MALAYMEIPLKGGGRAIVDVDDYELVRDKRWRKSRWGYAVRSLRVDGRSMLESMHRTILPTGRMVDHINGDPLDNRRENLRPADQHTNQYNRKGPQKNNTSGYLGVTTRAGGFEAKIRAAGHTHYLGIFRTAEEAARIRDAAAARLHGEFASLNFPDEAAA